MFKSPSPLPEKARTTIAETLNARLADGLDLHSQIKVAHWNVKGPQFAALHPLFETFAVSLATFNDTIAERAPNIRDLIVGRQVLTPLDIERQMGLTEGNIFQGELSLEQLFLNRPVPGWARFRTPVRELWLCGSSAHPGGGIMGAPGRIAALELLRERGRAA